MPDAAENARFRAFGEWLADQRERAGFGSQNNAAVTAARRRINLKQSRLSLLESGTTRRIDQDGLRALAKLYRLDYRVLAARWVAAKYALEIDVQAAADGEPIDSPRTVVATGSLNARLARGGIDVPEFAHVALLADPIAAGSPLVISDSDVDTWLAFQKSFVDRFTDPFLAKVGKHEESMLPDVGPGDVVLLDRQLAKRQRPDPRRIYAINRDDGGALKRVQVVGAGPKNGWLAVMSDNPDKGRYPTEFEPLKGRRLQDIIVGEVVWHGQHIGVGRRR